MSKIIDEKVVSMRLDNSNFEQNAQQSMSTIDKLNKGLAFAGAEKGFEVLSGATETVKLKFSALEIAAITAISNITNKAVDAGERLIKSLSIDNISAGWTKFGDKTVSVGTLISQGYDMDEVSDQLERLNWYTDETSYNFTDMVSNIAKFTATGQDLKTSVTAMEGIANWAALSGQNAQTASRAMYQISQAMGAGVMRLEDYKSIQNASMDTDEFRQKALEAAVELGTLKKVGEDTYTSLVAKTDAFSKTNFTKSLTEGQWFTSDVMMKVFNDYSAAVDQIYELSEEKGLTASEVIEEMGDQIDEFGLKAFKAAQEARTWGDVIDSVKDAVSTGWMNTFELVVGDYEEAKTFFTAAANELYDIFAEGGNRRNELLGWWKEQGGRDLLAESVSKSWEVFVNVLNAVKAGFRDIFPAMTGERLLGLTLKLNLFTEKLYKLFKSVEVDGEETNQNLIKIRTVVSGIFSVIKIGLNILTSAFKIVTNLSKNLAPLVKYLADGAYILGQWFTNVGKSAEETNIFAKAVETVTSVLQKAIDKVKEFVKIIWSKFEAPGWETFFHILSGIWDIVKKLGSILFGFIKDLGLNLAEALRSGDIKAVIDIFNGTLFATILMKIKGLVGGLGDIADVGKGFKGTISELFDSVKDSMTAWQNNLKANVIMKIAVAIGILTLALIALTGLDQEKLATSLGSITVLFVELFGEMQGFSKVAGQFTGNKVGATLIEFSVAIFILSAAVSKLAKLDPANVIVATAAVSTLIYVLGEMFNNLDRGDYIKTITKKSKLYKESITKTSFAMIEFAAAIYILVAAVEKLAKFSPQEIATGVGGVVALMYVITEMMNKLNSEKGFRFKKTAKGFTLNESIKSTGFALIEFAGAIYILTLAVDKIAHYSPQEILTGIGGVVVLMYTLTEMINKMNTNKGFLFKKTSAGFTLNESIKSTGFALMEFAGAIYILTLAVDKIAHYSPQEVITGVGGVVVLMYVMTELMEKLNKGTGSILKTTKSGISLNESMKSAGFALIEFASAIYILVLAVDKIAKYSPQEIATGVGGVVVLMYAMVELLGKLNDGSKSLLTSTKDAKVFKESTTKTAFALIEFSAAIYIVTLAVEKIAKMNLEEVAKGIGGVVAIMYVMTESMNKLSGKANLVQAGLGLIFFAAGVTVLAKALVIIGNMSLGDMIQGLIGLAAVLAMVVGAVEILQGFTKDLYAVGGAFALFGLGIALLGAGLLSLSLGLAALAGMSLAAVGALIANIQLLIVGVLDTIAGSADAIGRAIIAVITAGCQVVIQCTPQIIEALMVLFEETAKALATRIPTIVDLLFTFIIEILHVLQNRVPELIQEVIKFLSILWEAITQSVGEVDTTSLLEAFGAITLVTSLIFVFSNIMPMIPSAMVGVLGVAAVIAELTLIIAAIGALSMIPGFNTLVEGGGDLLGLVGTAIGKFFGGILGGIVEGITSNLPQIGTDLSLFMINLQPFILGAKMLDASTLEAVGILTGIILALTVAEIFDALTSWFTGGSSLEDFAKQLVPFGNAMVEFSETVSGKIDVEAVNAAAYAGQIMVALANDVPNSGGLLGMIVGNNDLDDFGEKLVSFGKSMVEFSQSITDENGSSLINTEAVSAAANAGELMIAMAKDVPNSGGILGFITGNNDLDDFGEQLVSFGSSIAKFSASIVDENGKSLINTEAVESAATAGLIMTELAKEIPNSGGVIGFIMGDNDIGKFGTELEAFGNGLAGFCNSITDENGNSIINEDAVKAAASASEMMVTLADKIPNQGGLISFFAGDNDLASFGEGLASFGGSLSQFGALASLIDAYQLQLVIASVERLVDLATRMEDLDTSGMEDFSENMTKLGDFGVENFINTFKNSDTRVQNAAKEFVLTFTKEVTNYKSEMVKVYTDLMTNGAIKTLESYSDEHETAAKKLMASFRSGAYSVSSLTSKVYTGMLDSIITAMEKYASKFSDTGKLLTEGLAKGMEDNQDLVKTAAENLVKVANDTVVEKSEINSPSKLFRRLGKFIPEGFALGIEDETSSVIRAIDYLTDTAYDETINTFENLNDVLSSGTEITPVIAPIYDPTNLNSMTYGLMRNIDTEMTRPVMSLSNQILDAQSRIEDSNNRVIESINQLGQNIREFADAQDKEINLYADTTKLASSIAKPLDRQLEAIAKRRR